MKLSWKGRPGRRLAARAASVLAGGALVAAGALAVASPAVAADGALTIAPATGHWQFGAGNPADSMSVTAPVSQCPANGTGYFEEIVLPGLEGTAGQPVGGSGIILGTPSTVDPPATAQIPSHSVSLTDQALPAYLASTVLLDSGSTSNDDALSPDDAKKAPGTVIAEETLDLAGFCYDANAFTVVSVYVAPLDITAATRPPKPADWPAGQYYDNLQWSWTVHGGGQPGPTATTTALSVSPSSPQPSGTAVTLAATVSPSSATGSVQFFDGGTPLGDPKTVTSGQAELTTSGLSVATHSLTAKFTPDDTGAFGASTSSAVPFEITSGGGASPGGTSGQVTIQTTVGQGTNPEELTLTVDSGSVTLPPPTVSGGDLVTTQNGVDLVTVNDNRSSTTPGWSATGQIGDTFVGATDNSHTVSGTSFGWTPSVLSPGSTGAVADGPVQAGSNPGLTGAGAGLAHAPSGSGIGSAKLGADLSLNFPVSTPADTYSDTVTISVM